MNTIVFATLWGQPAGGGGGDVIKLLIALLVLVGPILFRFLAEQGAKKDQKPLDDKEMQKQLHDAFASTPTEEEPAGSNRAKRERKRKRTGGVEPESTTASNVALSRQLAPQGEGSRFEAHPGTLGGLTLTPTVEPTVQPMLESLTGIYDEPTTSASQQSPLATELFQLLSTPTGIRQAVILGEILKRPEY